MASVDCFVASAPLRKRFAFVAGNDGDGAAPYEAVMPREGGASSTPRLFGSITNAPGILDRPPEPVIGRPFGRPGGGRRRLRVWRTHTHQIRLRDLTARCARAVHLSSAPWRAWGMPGARCTRGLVCTLYW